ncbi:MAG: GNAT family N-acetyltransferase [Gemmatimonadetes bacterium]|nr:GNAT family N-acetyltransferase [Gemmatimonadota bacterium]MBI3504490.1 GNAT family N-acetyltransferase [Pseudomonadota bacterium]
MSDIREARFPEDLDVVRELFREYADSLGVDLDFQGFHDELAGLPGKYHAPAGRVLLAMAGGEPVGCIAMRPLADGDCEMKRLYVRPAGRGSQLGRRLVLAICGVAREAGHQRIRLDTLPTMTAARALYASLGFVPIAPYVFNPIPGTAFMERDLRAEDEGN